jgi:hypothetical protein
MSEPLGTHPAPKTNGDSSARYTLAAPDIDRPIHVPVFMSVGEGARGEQRRWYGGSEYDPGYAVLS